MPLTEDELRVLRAAMGESDDLDHLNAVLAEVSERRNTTPLDDFAGLSPDEMTYFLYMPFDSPEYIQLPQVLQVEPEAPILELLMPLIDLLRRTRRIIAFDQPGMGLKEGDQYTGFDVAVAKYIASELGKTPEFSEAPTPQRETLLKTKQLDYIVGTYSITDARKADVDFAGPYLVAGQDLLVRADDDSINGPQDMEGKILCSVSGSTPAERVAEDYPGVQLQEYDTYSSCTEALRQGNIDAMTTDATILNGYAAQSPGEFRVVAMEQDGQPFTDEHYGIGLTKGDEEATEAVNDALTAMHDDGSFDQFVSDNLDAGDGVTPGTPGDLSFLDQ